MQISWRARCERAFSLIHIRVMAQRLTSCTVLCTHTVSTADCYDCGAVNVRQAAQQPGRRLPMGLTVYRATCRKLCLPGSFGLITLATVWGLPAGAVCCFVIRRLIRRLWNDLWRRCCGKWSLDSAHSHLRPGDLLITCSDRHHQR